VLLLLQDDDHLVLLFVERMASDAASTSNSSHGNDEYSNQEDDGKENRHSILGALADITQTATAQVTDVTSCALSHSLKLHIFLV
jgi:hypothetical protein